MLRTVLACAAVAVVLATATVASAAVINVDVFEYSFMPLMVTARPGDIIHWTNTGRVVHSVTSVRPGNPGQAFNATLNPGQSFDWTVPVPPQRVTVTYLCKFHYQAPLNMRGGKITIVP